VPVEVRPEGAWLKVDLALGAGDLGAVVVPKDTVQLGFESGRAGSGRA
jgi:hypothetical protein